MRASLDPRTASSLVAREESETDMTSRAENDMVAEGGRLLVTDDSYVDRASTQGATTIQLVRAGSEIQAGSLGERVELGVNQDD